jgi:hypothetical protein
MSLETPQIVKLVLEGGVAVVALFALIMYIFQQRNKDNKDAAERMSYLDLLKLLANNIETSTKAMQAVEASIKVVGADAQSAATILREARDSMQIVSQRRDEQLQKLQAAVDNMPAAVREQLVDDFEAIGDSLKALNDQTLESHNNVRRVLAEWMTTGSRLQQIIQRFTSTEAGDEAQSAPAPETHESETSEEKEGTKG